MYRFSTIFIISTSVSLHLCPCLYFITHYCQRT